MIVIIEDEVFSSRSSQLDLLGLIQLGLEGVHRIQTDPIFGTGRERALTRWLADLPLAQREEITLVLESGLEEDASGYRPDVTVRIGLFQRPDWESSPACLPLPVGLSFLRRPLCLLLENSRNDGAFLNTIAPSHWRERYLRLLNQRAIELSNGGGLTDMRAKLEQTKTEEALRLWTLFDSDAREPGRPSQQSEALRRVCQDRGVAHHQLRRRFIESYLPVKALLDWAYSGPTPSRQTRMKKAQAFAAMEEPQRHHFNIKGGFKRDRPQGIPAHFGHHASNPHLQEGFGDSISELFHATERRIQEGWLIKDGQGEEAAAIFQSIFRRL